MTENIPRQSVELHLQILRKFGYYKLDSNNSRIRKLLQVFYMKFILICISTFIVQQIIKVFQVKDDINKVLDTMFLLLTNSGSIYKQILFWLKHNEIEEMLNILKNPIFQRDETKHRVQLLRTARQAIVLLRTFNIAALTTCLLWVLYPMILYAQGKPVEFAIWLPFDPTKSPQFFFAITYVWIQTSWLAYANTSMDTFISYFFAQCKTQLSILRYELENVVEKCEEEAEKQQKPFHDIYRDAFKNILLHYNLIIKLSYKTQDIFGGTILYLFMISGWIICISAYRMTDSSLTTVAFISLILYIICILIEIYLYCYFGNEVAFESEMLLQSAFALNWYKIPIESRRSLIIFMERIKRPIIPIAGIIIPLSNNTFVSIIRSSYTFYAFLKNSN